MSNGPVPVANWEALPPDLTSSDDGKQFQCGTTIYTWHADEFCYWQTFTAEHIG
jgi:hypothetical protein